MSIRGSTHAALTKLRTTSFRSRSRYQRNDLHLRRPVKLCHTIAKLDAAQATADLGNELDWVTGHTQLPPTTLTRSLFSLHMVHPPTAWILSLSNLALVTLDPTDL